MRGADLEALILQDPLDGSVFTARRQLGLEDDSERAVADDLALGVLHFLCFSGQAILDLLAYDLWKMLLVGVDGRGRSNGGLTSHTKIREGI